MSKPRTKIDKTCIECKTDKGKLSSVFHVYLCDGCKLEDKYTLITKTNTKKNYLLHDNELINLTPIERNSSYGPATYYTKSNIFTFLSRKYNIDYDDVDGHIQELFDDKEEQKKERKRRLEDKKDAEKINRRRKLIAALAEYDLELRDDSELCRRYLEGIGELDEYRITNRMCQMRYLFEYCHMNECKDEAYEEHVAELEAGYIPDCRVFDRAEEIALNKYSDGEYPMIYPWMEKYLLKRK